MYYDTPAIEPPATGTRRILQQLLDNITALLEDTPQLSDSGIHEIRKTCKRLRALLAMVRPKRHSGSFRKADREIRDLARQLAGMRDSKVLTDTIDKIAQHFSPLLSDIALSPVRDSLQAQLATNSENNAASADSRTLQKRLKRVRRAIGRIDCTLINRKTLVSGMMDCYRNGKHAYSKLEETPDTDNAHDLRKQAKYLYYQLQFVAGWNNDVLAPLIENFHRLEDTLGNDHDLAVLAQTLAKQTQLCPDKTRKELLNALVESRRIALLSGALRLAGKLYADTPGRFRKQLKSAFSQLD
jgi:CHAD domain-containing protein